MPREATQEDAQTIIGELRRTKGLAQQVAQRMMETLSPLLNMDLGVVTMGEDEGDPASGQGAVGQPLMVALGAEVAVEQFGQP